MEDNQIANLLMIILGVFAFILVVLVIIYIMLIVKNKKREKNISNVNGKENESEKNSKKTKNSMVETVQVEEFMEFDRIEDNMIIQKDKFKYIMIIECQGVNYDLMSGIEKNGVEEGFVQFLNTLKHPIQLYIQTRTINLEGSLTTYRSKVNKIKEELYRREQEYQMIMADDKATTEMKQKALFALTRQRNLYEYGTDIIRDTEQMSKNSNILNKKYYIVIPYYVSELGDEEFNDYEIKNIAFSELYTRSQAIIRALSSCSVNGKILSSKELVELLYIAYNRDQEEIYSLENALASQYDKLYVTGEDVYKKRIRELDNQIEREAIEKAKKNIDIAKNELEEQITEKEANMDDLINEMAKIILDGNRNYIDEEIIDKAIENIDNETKEKEESNEKEKKTRRNSSKR